MILRRIVFKMRETTPHSDDRCAGRSRNRWLTVTAWAALLGVCFALDTRIVTFVRDHVYRDELRSLLRVIWWFGHIGVTVAIACALCVWHPWRWRAGAYLIASGLAGAAMYAVIKWSVGRIRPFKGVDAFDWQPFGGGMHGLFIGVPNATFPSGHATLVFLTAACLRRLYPRWGPVLYGVAVLVGLSRVIRGAHYPSDVVAGAALGVLTAWLMWTAGQRHGLLPCDSNTVERNPGVAAAASCAA
jgi:membrane-associated phospholipid phosphatase